MSQDATVGCGAALLMSALAILLTEWLALMPWVTAIGLGLAGLIVLARGVWREVRKG
jgi:hypothetical protein